MNKKKKLITLAENNARNWNTTNMNNTPRKNGVACPNCGEELYDTNPMITLTSYPAQKTVHCDKCGYKGYRVI